MTLTDYSSELQALLDVEPPLPVGVRSAAVDYTVDGTACQGYLARPDDDSERPAVLVLPDWLGVTDYARMRADQLARLGYVGFVGDVYGADVRPSDSEAPQVAGRFYGDQQLWRSRIVGAYERMVAEPHVDSGRTAAVGYCFGGAGALQLARTGTDVSGVVSLHGGLATGPEGEAAGIAAKVLILHGAEDPVAPEDALVAIMNEFRSADDLDWQVVVYAGAMHAFTLPDANAPEHGAQYHPVAERRSWSAEKAFLAEVLGQV